MCKRCVVMCVHLHQLQAARLVRGRCYWVDGARCEERVPTTRRVMQLIAAGLSSNLLVFASCVWHDGSAVDENFLGSEHTSGKGEWHDSSRFNIETGKMLLVCAQEGGKKQLRRGLRSHKTYTCRGWWRDRSIIVIKMTKLCAYFRWAG